MAAGGLPYLMLPRRPSSRGRAAASIPSAITSFSRRCLRGITPLDALNTCIRSHTSLARGRVCGAIPPLSDASVRGCDAGTVGVATPDAGVVPLSIVPAGRRQAEAARTGAASLSWPLFSATAVEFAPSRARSSVERFQPAPFVPVERMRAASTRPDVGWVHPPHVPQLARTRRSKVAMDQRQRQP